LILGETKNCEIPEMIAQEVIELKIQINKIIGESYLCEPKSFKGTE